VGQPTEARLIHRSASMGARLLGVPFLLPLVLLLCAIGILLGNCLLGVDRLAFRDVSHFYTPLYGYVAAQERTHWLPLYNDLDHTGIPLAGETTSALFYPIRRIVFRLIDSPETAIAWYIALHLALAGIAAAWAAKNAGASRFGASIAMIAYPLSGPIWFLYTNPPFLVGAAWLPLALGGGFSMLRLFRLSDLLVTSASLAMMILAGDPQTAVHVVLIGSIVWFARTIVLLATARRDSVISSIRRSFRSIGSLAAALLLTTLLAAPQIAASIDWAPQSVRYAGHNAASRHEIFAFSVAPWHWAELLAPSISGFLFPQYSRISHLLSGDGRTWAITLYSGLLPLSLAVLRYKRFLPPIFAQQQNRRRLARLDGWDCIVPIGLIFAMGNLSLGAFIRWFQPQWVAGIDDLLLHPYGWLVAWLPGYDGFRYPAKWLVFVPLGITIAAARQAGHWSATTSTAASRIAVVLAMVSFLIAASVVILLNVGASIYLDFAERSDSIWGPMDYSAAGWFVATSTLAVICLAKLFDAVNRVCNHRHSAFCYLLVLVVIDLGMVARHSLATVNRSGEQFLIDSVNNQSSVTAVTNRSQGAPLRALRFASRGWPVDLRTTASPPGDQRVLVVEASMRSSLFGRWHLASDTAVFNSPTSLPPGRLRTFWSAANNGTRKLSVDGQSLYWTRLMRWMAIDQSWNVEDSVGGLPRGQEKIAITSLVRKPIVGTLPMVTWHSQWREVDAIENSSSVSFAQRIKEIVSSTSATDIPWIEVSTKQQSRQNPFAAASARPRESDGEVAELINATCIKPGQWNILVDSSSDGLICIRQFQDGNFHARIHRWRPIWHIKCYSIDCLSVRLSFFCDQIACRAI
jgi:hypothetical protein